MAKANLQNEATALREKCRFKRSWPTTRTVGALVLREMSVSYGRSPGGYLWAFLEPAAGILALTFLFSKAFQAPPLGHSFALFYATGLIPFLAYADITSKLSQSLNFSRQLLAYPAVTFVDAILARFVLNFLTQMLVGYGLFMTLWLLVDGRTFVALDALIVSYAMLASLVIGIGTLNSVFISLFPIWQQIWSIINRPLIIVSCVFFLYDSVPHPYSDWLWWNPLIHLIGQTRTAFFPFYDAAYVEPIYVFGLSLFLFIFGLVFLKRYHREIVYG